MKAIDQVLVEGQGEQFALLAPEVINDYVETLGKPCQNPLGYTAGSLILAKDLEGVQRMFKVTANISSSQNVVEGTNVERKKLEDLFDGIEEEIGDVDQELGSVKQALSDEVTTRAELGAHNLAKQTGFSGSSNGVNFTTNSNKTLHAAGTLTANTTAEFRYLENNVQSSIDLCAFLKTHTCILSGGKSAKMHVDVGYYTINGTYISNQSSTGGEVTLNPPSNAETMRIVVNIGTYAEATAINEDFSVLIKSATDRYNGFTAPAMTNQQLTENLAGNLVLVEKGTVLVTSDGVKTWKKMLKEAYDAFAAKVSSESDYYFDMIGFTYATTLYNPYLYKGLIHGTLSGSMPFSRVHVNSSRVEDTLLNISVTENDCYSRVAYNNIGGSNTYADISETAVSNAQELGVVYKKYKKVG